MVNQIIFSSILQTWYVELRISRSMSESPLEFEITRVDCRYSHFFTKCCEYLAVAPRRGAFHECRQEMYLYLWNKNYIDSRTSMARTSFWTMEICSRYELYSRLSLSRTRLSRSENLVPVITQRSTNRQQNIVEKRRNCSLGAISPLFHNIFNISLT